MRFPQYNLIKGFSLLELILALFISSLILSSVISVYIGTQSIHQEQAALIEMIENSIAAFHILKSEFNPAHTTKVWPYHDVEMKTNSMAITVYHKTTNEKNTFFIGKTKRMNDRGDPVYALYRIDTKQHKAELVEGVHNMRIQYTILANDKIHKMNESELSTEENVMGIEIELTFISTHFPYLTKIEYSYVSL